MNDSGSIMSPVLLNMRHLAPGIRWRDRQLEKKKLLKRCLLCSGITPLKQQTLYAYFGIYAIAMRRPAALYDVSLLELVPFKIYKLCGDGRVTDYE